MKTIPAFAAFDRVLKGDQAAADHHKREALGIEDDPTEPRRRGPKKSKEPRPAPATLGLPGELVAQAEAVAELLGLSRAGFVRLALAAAIEAMVIELEERDTITLPLQLAVKRERPQGFYYPNVRRISRERFESLRTAGGGAPLAKWLKRHPDDQTGNPMPPPQSRILNPSL